MYSRLRELDDPFGTCLRIGVAVHPDGALLSLQRRDGEARAPVLLTLHGAELLLGFLHSARLVAPGAIPEESSNGAFPVRLRLIDDQEPVILLEQRGRVRAPHRATLILPSPLWDRLYAELLLATAHARELERREEPTLH